MFPRRTAYLRKLEEVERERAKTSRMVDEFVVMVEHLAESERQNEKREEPSE